jgi:hypothetical protein
VILKTPEEVDVWLTAPPEETLKLQRPLPDGTFRIVARGNLWKPLQLVCFGRRPVSLLSGPMRSFRKPSGSG